MIPVAMTRLGSASSAGSLTGRCFARVANVIRADTRHLVINSGFATPAIYNVSDVGYGQGSFRHISRHHAQTTSFWRSLKYLKKNKKDYSY